MELQGHSPAFCAGLKRILLLVTGLLGSSCGTTTLIEAPPPPAAFESYADALERTGLAGKAIGAAWLSAGKHALEHAPEVLLPHRAVVYFDPHTPSSRAFRFMLRRGQRLTLSAEGDAAGVVFLDLFREPPALDAAVAPSLERVAGSDAGALIFEVAVDGAYVARVQPELMIGGRFELSLEAVGALSFPVSGKASDAIKSPFGAPRDGGRRKHEGVDIFAPKGTPVLAAADGWIARAGEGGLGGKSIWQHVTGKNYGLYYAHLDQHLVGAGTWVRAGDEIGTVGNTGNARFTPPHLHFGIYQRRALDPSPFLFRPMQPAPAPDVPAELFGAWSRVGRRAANVRGEPSARGPLLETLKKHTAVRVVGGIGKWAEVETSEGRRGFVFAKLLEPAALPVGTMEVSSGWEIFRGPGVGAVPTATLTAQRAIVLAHGDGESYVNAGGRLGWVRGDTVGLSSVRGASSDSRQARQPAYPAAPGARPIAEPAGPEPDRAAGRVGDPAGGRDVVPVVPALGVTTR